MITAVAGETEMLLDQRHAVASELATMLARSRQACTRAAERFGCTVRVRHTHSVAPTTFDGELVALARAAVVAAGGSDRAIRSGPLHHAVEMARLIYRPRWCSHRPNRRSHTPRRRTLRCGTSASRSTRSRAPSTGSCRAPIGWPHSSPTYEMDGEAQPRVAFGRTRPKCGTATRSR